MAQIKNTSLIAKQATKIAEANQKKVTQLTQELKNYKHSVITLVKQKKLSKQLKEDSVFKKFYQRALDDKSFSGTSYEAAAIALYSTIIYKVFRVDPFKESKVTLAIITILFELAISLIARTVNYLIPKNAITEVSKFIVVTCYNYISAISAIYFRLYEPYGKIVMVLLTGMIAGVLIVLLTSRYSKLTVVATLGVTWLISIGVVQLLIKLAKAMREGSLKIVRKLLLVIMVLMRWLSTKFIEIQFEVK